MKGVYLKDTAIPTASLGQEVELGVVETGYKVFDSVRDPGRFSVHLSFSPEVISLYMPFLSVLIFANHLTTYLLQIL